MLCPCQSLYYPWFHVIEPCGPAMFKYLHLVNSNYKCVIYIDWQWCHLPQTIFTIASGFLERFKGSMHSSIFLLTVSVPCNCSNPWLYFFFVDILYFCLMKVVSKYMSLYIPFSFCIPGTWSAVFFMCHVFGLLSVNVYNCPVFEN